MPRVAGCDPGTSSLDVLVLDDGTVADQARFEPERLRSDPTLPVRCGGFPSHTKGYIGTRTISAGSLSSTLLRPPIAPQLVVTEYKPFVHRLRLAASA